MEKRGKPKGGAKKEGFQQKKKRNRGESCWKPTHFLLERSIPGMILGSSLFLISFLTNSHFWHFSWVFGLLIGVDARGHSFCLGGLWLCILCFWMHFGCFFCFLLEVFDALFFPMNFCFKTMLLLPPDSLVHSSLTVHDMGPNLYFVFLFTFSSFLVHCSVSR